MMTKILVVDDEPAVRNALRSVLATYGMDVAVAASAMEGFELLRKHDFDCILTDVKMPDIDGLAFQRLLQQHSIVTPVIIMTGHGDVPMAVQAVRSGAFDFIEKPIDDEYLAKTIDAAKLQNQKLRANGQERRLLLDRYESLTAQERLVAGMVSEGYSTAAIAAQLEISPRTVDHHRAKILAKMQATTLPQLLKFLMKVLDIQAQ